MHCLCPDFASEGDHLYSISANVLLKSINDWSVIASDKSIKTFKRILRDKYPNM